MFSPSYNKGEWAELYVLARILCDKSLKVRSHGETSETKSLTVKQIRRGLEPTSETYSFEDDQIVCEHSSSRISHKELCNRVSGFLQRVKQGKGSSFSLVEGDELLALLDISQLKKGSGHKSDIYIDAVDPLTGTTGIQGYTIKALLGSKPSLFNASEPTNITFRIDPQLSVDEINEYNKRDKNGKLVNGIRDTVAKLLDTQHTMTFKSMDQRFKDNLELLDSRMPEFITEFLLSYYSRKIGRVASVKKTIEYLSAANPLQVSNPALWYPHKVKDFLEASAYGMVPTEPYNGERSAAGGLLLVEKNGDLSCFLLDDKDKSRSYLIEHTYFDTAQRDKHRFGEIINVGSESQLKLNLQVRYK